MKYHIINYSSSAYRFDAITNYLSLNMRNYMFRIFFILLAVLNFSKFSSASETQLTCYTKFIGDKPTNQNVPIWYASINIKAKHMDWSDISKKAERKLDIFDDSVILYAESGFKLNTVKKTVAINRINGTFMYFRPNEVKGATLYEGQCEIGIKKKIF